MKQSKQRSICVNRIQSITLSLIANSSKIRALLRVNRLSDVPKLISVVIFEG